MKIINKNLQAMYIKCIGTTSALLVDEQEKEHRVPVWMLKKDSTLAESKIKKSRKGGKA